MNLSALTIQQLRYVVAVDRHRSFREAAAACCVSQPALSTQLKKVEEMFGTTLFDRARQPIVPTERGAQVVAQARIALEHVDRIGVLLGTARGEELSGAYRLGVIPTLAPTMIPLFLQRFVRAHPRVDLSIEEATTDVLLRRLRDGTLDGGLAATPLDVPGIHEQVVCHEAFFVYLPAGHPLADRPSVTQADLIDEHVWLLSEGHCFRTQVLHLCSADRRRDGAEEVRVRFDPGSFEALIHLVDTGLGVTLLPELLIRALPAAQQAAQVRPFAPLSPVREVSFLHAREHAHKEVADALLGILREGVPPALRGRSGERGAVVRPLGPGSHGA
jgi:LysR family hydrogen peroxide-inducible transcriptional activator